MVDSKQWIIAKRPYLGEGFLHRRISAIQGDFILSYHNELNVQVSNDGKTFLLGYAWPCIARNEKLVERASRCKSQEDVEAETDAWSGRWVLLHGDCLYADAAGLMSVFIASGAISCSPHVLDRYLERRPRDPRVIHEFGLDYFPGPLTPSPGTTRLLPSLGFNLFSWSTFYRPLVRALSFANVDEAVETFLEEFKNMLLAFRSEWHGEIWLPITSGFDSRTIMAMLEYAKIKYVPYTSDHPRITKGDVEIPKLLSKAVGKTHHFIKRKEADLNRRAEFDLHCGRYCAGLARRFYSYRQYQEIECAQKPVALLRGHVWEVSAEYYRTHGLFVCEKPEELVDVSAKHFVNIRYRADIRRSLSFYAQHLATNPQSLDIPNRVLFEQRSGCWASMICQALDMLDGVITWNPINSRRLISILLSFPVAEREKKYHQERIIGAACPALLKIPFRGDNSFAHLDEAHPSAPVRFTEKLNSHLASWRQSIYALGFRGLVEQAIARRLFRK